MAQVGSGRNGNAASITVNPHNVLASRVPTPITVNVHVAMHGSCEPSAYGQPEATLRHGMVGLYSVVIKASNEELKLGKWVLRL